MTFNWQRPPIAGSAVSAVLPAINVESTLQSVLQSTDATLKSLNRDYEILLIDDGSSDNTVSIGQDFSVRQPRLQLIQHESPQGYGHALRTGLAAAKHSLVFTMPADGSYDPADLHGFLTLINHVDVVVGRRRSYSWLKRQFQSWSAFKYFGLWFKDPACPFRLYRRAIFDRIPIQSNGRFADVEILAKANFLGCLLTEREIAWKPTPYRHTGPSALADGIRVFRKPSFLAPATATESAPAT